MKGKVWLYSKTFYYHDSVFCCLFKISLFRFFVQRIAKVFRFFISQDIFTRSPVQLPIFKPRSIHNRFAQFFRHKFILITSYYFVLKLFWKYLKTNRTIYLDYCRWYLRWVLGLVRVETSFWTEFAVVTIFYSFCRYSFKESSK